MELNEVLRALRSGWWFLLVGALVGPGLALGVSLLQTPMYVSNTQLFVSATEVVSTSDAFQGSQLSAQRVASYARLLQGEDLASRVVDDLDLSVTPATLAQRISAVPVVDTVLIDVSVEDPSPRQAQRIAEAVGVEFSNLVDELEATGETGAAPPVRVTVTDRPNLPDSADSPKIARNLAIGLAGGLFLGAAVSILRLRLDRTVRDAEDASALSGSPVIGVIVRDEALAAQHTIERNGVGRSAEGYRQLRTNLQFLNIDEPPKVIMVSSAVPSEGKTTLAVNLALSLVEAGRSVTLIEADLRRPRVTRYLGMVGGVGLTNILTGSAAVEDVEQPYGDGDLTVIAAGPTPPNPSELLSSSHMFSLIDDLRVKNDFVLLDAPPLLPVADASGLAVLVDGVVLSLRYGSTTKEQLAQTQATLGRVGAKTLGIVLNIVPPKAEVTSAYGYGYNYGYDPDPTAPTTS
ncbi:polysaccharide biosynthesis tyrosine autokinase [Klenkia brasiliensis]|uniref:Receptor protein-tyrosine kinase n=1 Tax=Klenkia brasiliensis TaxID=333142 RepID=A0A1G7MRZ7_9ACTN|nr:polysaccharide biosynthesis tyrosine autokinase [Klenkia brasiliensis]SDF64494.1 receptor protein-tyrosine kinase [Klenkia brasiliensis]